MYNIYDTLPDNFFNLFSGNNKRIIADCLYILYNSFHNDLSFSSSKLEMIYLLQDYFDTHVTVFDDEEQVSTSKEKAYAVIRRLNECGWTTEETGENYDVYVTFQDYSMKVMSTLFSLERESETEYSGIVYNIYVLFSNFDVNRGDLIFETGYENTRELANKLKNLNSNIKKYIQNLLKEGMKDDLEKLLNTLLQDYQTKIIDRAYYNLTTYDNPSKYRQRIINSIQNIMNNEQYTNIIVRNIMERKEMGYEKAYELLMKQGEYIIDSFEHIEDIMNEIDQKNNKFVQSAINRITFLLNHQKDVEGKINNIIKFISKGNEIEDLGNIYLNQMIHKESLYTPRKLSQAIKIETEQEVLLDEKLKEESLRQIIKSQKYSHKYIESIVMKLLKDKKEFLGSSLPLNDHEELATLVLIYLYGYTFGSKYEIEPLDQMIVHNEYRFKDFKVKIKEKIHE